MDALQPGLSPRFQRGTFTPGWQSVQRSQGLHPCPGRRFRANGGTLARGRVVALRPAGDGVTVALEGGETLPPGMRSWGRCAFPHSPAALATASRWKPNAATTPTCPPVPSTCARRSPSAGTASSSRLTSAHPRRAAVELGGLDLPPNFRRAEAMLKKRSPSFRASGHRRHAMDGLPPLAARRCPPSACPRQPPRDLCLRSWPHRAHAIRRHRAAGGRSGHRRSRPSTSPPSRLNASEGPMATHTFSCIDGHTCGKPRAPGRGRRGPRLEGATMLERRAISCATSTGSAPA